jgi:hypothetical protein
MYNPGCNPPDYLYRSFFSVVEEFMAQAMRLPHYAWLGLAKTIHMYIYTVKLRFLWLHPWVPQSPFQYGQRHRAIQASVHLRVRPAWYSARGAHGREITKYTVICGVYIRFWPTLSLSNVESSCHCLRIFFHCYTSFLPCQLSQCCSFVW